MILTQTNYRLWARIGPTYGSGTLYPTDVEAQLAAILAERIANEYP